jgi:hypothetical protein
LPHARQAQVIQRDLKDRPRDGSGADASPAAERDQDWNEQGQSKMTAVLEADVLFERKVRPFEINCKFTETRTATVPKT